MQNIRTRIITGVVILFLGLLPALPVRAQSNGLGITPRKELTITAGQSGSDTLYINNLSKSQPLSLSVRVIDFKAADETGSPQLDLRNNIAATPWSIKPFIKIADKVDLPVGKSTNVPFTISIPAGQGAGSYYSAVQFLAGTSGDKQVTLAASGVSLIFVRVPGQAREILQLQKFGAFTPTPDKSSGQYGTFFFTKPPQQFAYKVKNSGNVAEAPAGSIVIKSIFGKRIKIIEEANAYRDLAIRDQVRRFDACVVDKKTSEGVLTGKCDNFKMTPGIYIADLTLLYGQNGSNINEIHARTVVWYLPIWFLAIVTLVLVVIALAVRWVYKRLTRARKHH